MRKAFNAALYQNTSIPIQSKLTSESFGVAVCSADQKLSALFLFTIESVLPDEFKEFGRKIYVFFCIVCTIFSQVALLGQTFRHCQIHCLHHDARHSHLYDVTW